MHEIERTARGSVAEKVCQIHNKMDAPGCAGEASMWSQDLVTIVFYKTHTLFGFLGNSSRDKCPQSTPFPKKSNLHAALMGWSGGLQIYVALSSIILWIIVRVWCLVQWSTKSNKGNDLLFMWLISTDVTLMTLVSTGANTWVYEFHI